MMILLRMMDPIWLSEERALTSRNLALFQVTPWGPMTMDRELPFLSPSHLLNGKVREIVPTAQGCCEDETGS